MNSADFIRYISDPTQLGKESLVELSEIIREFPYCQSARILYAKNLHQLKDIRYSNNLKIAAIYAADRKALYHLLMQPALVEKIHEIEKEHPVAVTAEPEAPVSEVKSPESQAAIDSEEKPTLNPVSNQGKENPVSALEQEILKEALAASYKIESETQPEAEEIIKEPVRLKERMTFLEWMAAMKSGPSQETVTKKASASSIDELLAKLSGTETKASPKKEFFTPSAMGRLSLVEDDKFVTETLAKIYEQQGNYAKAISAYKNLSLKYPEKSSYFASRILTLEKLVKTK